MTTRLEEETRDATRTENDRGWENRVAMNEKSTFRAQLAEPGPKEPEDFARALPERLTPERSKTMTAGKVPEDAGADLKGLSNLLPEAREAPPKAPPESEG